MTLLRIMDMQQENQKQPESTSKVLIFVADIDIQLYNIEFTGIFTKKLK